jgi:hypothetical protein
VSSEESRTNNRDAMDAAVQHLHVVTLYLYFEEEGGHDPVVCCSASGTGMAPSPPSSTATDSVPDSHVTADVVGEDASILVAAARPAARPRPPQAGLKS